MPIFEKDDFLERDSCHELMSVIKTITLLVDNMNYAIWNPITPKRTPAEEEYTNFRSDAEDVRQQLRDVRTNVSKLYERVCGYLD
jgi:type II secretory pathway component PulM